MSIYFKVLSIQRTGVSLWHFQVIPRPSLPTFLCTHQITQSIYRTQLFAMQDRYADASAGSQKFKSLRNGTIHCFITLNDFPIAFKY